jgi:hypothetical protein
VIGDILLPGCSMGRTAREVRISSAFLAQLITPSVKWSPHLRCQTGLPEGAKLIDVRFDAGNDQIVTLWEHESFSWHSENWPPLEVLLASRICDHPPAPEATS